MVFDVDDTNSAMPTSFAYRIHKCSNGYRDVVRSESTGLGVVTNLTLSGTAATTTMSDVATQVWGVIPSSDYNYGILIVPDG